MRRLPLPPAARASCALASTVLLAAAAAPEVDLAPSVDYATGIFPTALDVADLDEDGRPDVVTTNSISGDLSLLLNRGAGRLAVERRIAGTGGQPRDVACGDVDGDGHIDIVTAVRSGTSAADVYLGLGGGAFAAPLGVGVPGASAALALEDLNGDEHLDIVVAGLALGLTDPVVSVYPGVGDGTFGAPAITSLLPGMPAIDIDLDTGDIDDDGSLDLVVVGYPFGSFSALFMNRGDGSFDFTLRPPAAAQLMGVSLGDVNGDGHLDVSLFDGSPALGVGLVVEPGDGLGGFGAPQRWALGGRAGFKEARRAIATGDLDLDGRTDVVTTGGIFRGAPGGFDVVARPDIGRFAAHIVDMDADGYPDLVTVGHDGAFAGRVRLYLNEARGSGPLRPIERAPRAANPFGGPSAASFSVTSPAITPVGQP